MKNRGFIKLYRNVLSKPEMTDLVAEQGAAGLGVYIMVLLYLSQCDDFEGAFTNGQLSAFAAQARKPRRYVRQIICGYHLFEVDGKRFRVAPNLQQSLNEISTKPSHSPARINRYAGEELEVDIEKENKEKADVRVSDDTHPALDKIGPSAYEMIDRDGVRRGSRGEKVPWWAPPQTDIRLQWSVVADSWVPPDQVDRHRERQRRREMAPEDFMMKTAYEALTEQQQQRIQDYARREF